MFNNGIKNGEYTTYSGRTNCVHINAIKALNVVQTKILNSFLLHNFLIIFYRIRFVKLCGDFSSAF